MSLAQETVPVATVTLKEKVRTHLQKHKEHFATMLRIYTMLYPIMLKQMLQQARDNFEETAKEGMTALEGKVFDKYLGTGRVTLEATMLLPPFDDYSEDLERMLSVVTLAETSSSRLRRSYGRSRSRASTFGSSGANKGYFRNCFQKSISPSR